MFGVSRCQCLTMLTVGAVSNNAPDAGTEKDDTPIDAPKFQYNNANIGNIGAQVYTGHFVRIGHMTCLVL